MNNGAELKTEREMSSCSLGGAVPSHLQSAIYLLVQHTHKHTHAGLTVLRVQHVCSHHYSSSGVVRTAVKSACLYQARAPHPIVQSKEDASNAAWDRLQPL